MKSPRAELRLGVLLTFTLLAFKVSPSAGSDLSFDGSLCTIDCSGHQAGYNWAQRHGIADPDDCGGSSESFKQGCRSYPEGGHGSVHTVPSLDDEDDSDGGHEDDPDGDED